VSGLSLLAPLGLAALIALPAIVVLYMRTTTPTDQRVPSTRFWLGAQTVPTENRRLRPPPITPLFLIHLLIAVLIAFALAEPASAHLLSRFGSRTQPQHLILIIDGSTSMQAAVDPLGVAGRTRFDLAKSVAGDRLDGLGTGDVVSVLVLGTHTTTFEASGAVDIDRLRGQVDRLRSPGGRADFNAAMRLCRDLLLPGLHDEVVVITDGAVNVDPALVDEIAAPIDLEIVSGSISTNNLAIIEINARGSISIPGRQDLFFRIANFGNQAVTTNVNVSVDGVSISDREITLPGGATTSLTESLPAGSETATATLAAADALAADNRASVSLADSGAIGIRMLLVSDAPGALLRALSALPGSQVEALSVNQYLATTRLPVIDLIVFEGAAPAGSMPDVPALIVNPGAGQDLSAGFMPAPEPTRLRSQDPILNGVDLAGVTFGQVPVLPLAPGDVEVVGAENGPLIFRTELANGQPAVVLAFDIAETNLPVRVAFPIMVSNLVSTLVARQIPASVSVGDPITISPHAGAASFEVTNSLGTLHTIPVEQTTDSAVNRTVSFADTGVAGPYFVRELDTSGNPITLATIMVNAGHPQESNLAPNPLLEDAMQSSAVESDQASRRDQIELWPLVLAALLGLLMIEWLLTLRQERQRLPAAEGARS
jgi:Ca-activated chloride channel family protein